MKIKRFIKDEIVLTVSVILALISMLIVRPDAGYKDYIHWSTLSILLSLMLVMSGFKELGVFRYLGRQLLKRQKHARSVMLILVGLCFFLSPFIKVPAGSILPVFWWFSPMVQVGSVDICRYLGRSILPLEKVQYQ